jgi:UDP-N-acetylglucosamine diphosphorylase/glucosamine-1-phosphate N-acetyltransferase
VYANESELASDFTLLKKNPASKSQQVHKSAALINRRNIWIGRRANLGAGVVLDASNGPIYVGNDVRIFPTAVIEGPCYIGDGTLIKIGAKVYGNTSIGSMCKVGGEVEHSILHSHCNKQHDGFLGHSYTAPWVNLGAGTTTSNLKNTYGSVRVHVNGQQVDSGKMFVGLVAGDHVKVGINGTIDTGTVIGPSSNIYGTGLFPKYIPPFSWGASSSFSTYDLERAINVASTVMSRRGVTMSDEYKKLFRYIYELTSNERASYRD